MLADKKKLIIVVVLAIAVIGVGAFLFTGGSTPPAAKGAQGAKNFASHSSGHRGAADAGSTTSASPNGTGGDLTASGTQTGQPNPSSPDGTVAPQQEQSLAARDPFDGSKFMPADSKKPATQPSATKPPTKPVVKLDKLAPLPLTQIGGKGIGFPPSQSKINTPTVVFDYSLTGVVTGDVPLAVFTDSKGNQRLVKEGASLDGDTKVIAIGHGAVTVSFHGKTKTLTVGADTPTEKRTDEK